MASEVDLVLDRVARERDALRTELAQEKAARQGIYRDANEKIDKLEADLAAAKAECERVNGERDVAVLKHEKLREAMGYCRVEPSIEAEICKALAAGKKERGGY